MRRLPLLFVLLLAPAPVRADDFTEKVRPILARACFKCHGPDDKARKGKLRLDTAEGATRPARSGKAAVVPGKPAESELVARVLSHDETEVMPPPSSKIALSPEERRTLEAWVKGGATYTAHWAFLPVRRPAPPRVRGAHLARNPIDLFVLARLEAAGRTLSPEADRLALARRVYLDLVGVPPTPDEADAFALDDRPDAYERLVGALLASPRYGERWARRWLDLARYADTNGYEKDRFRSIWPWRDWVIAALNAGMPFDRFTIEQLAGDMLPGATPEQIVATGFHRNTMLNEEGGIDPLEFRYHAVADRVATTGAVWLGLTTGCAQCHTHKFDPITHHEYFGLFAFLNNADEPEREVLSPEAARRRRAIAAEIAALERGFAEAVPDREARFTKWLADTKNATSRWQALRPREATANVPKLAILPDDSIFAQGDTSKRDVYTLRFKAPASLTAIRIEAMPDERLPKGGPGRVYYEGPHGDFFLSEVGIKADGKPLKFAHSTAPAAIDGDPQTGWSINGGQGKAHTATFTLPAAVKAEEIELTLVCERYHAAGLGRFRVWATDAAKPASLKGFPCDVEAALFAEKRSPEQAERLTAEFLRTVPETAKARAEIAELRKRMPSVPTTLVMSERPADVPRPTFLHHRGEFLEPGERVAAGVPAILPGLGKGLPRNRLGFAKWLVSDENPLTPRVAVNREWAALFGQGIVATVQDFGLQGEAPSHPELLDWLADEFRRGGWSLKDLHRLIVTSATYRQSSGATAEAIRLDPRNRLLGRGPRVRLEAEALRDGVLRASGLLAERLGGPSVFPPQPPGVTTEGTYGAMKWEVSPGPDRYRRGLYTFSKRTAPYALFGTFDGPSGEVCVARREVSNTALQALTMLNDQTILEAARALGRRMAEDKGGDAERARSMFRAILTRRPTAAEEAALTGFLRARRANPGEAAELAGDGPGEARERAAWVALARALFNVDEFITKG